MHVNSRPIYAHAVYTLQWKSSSHTKEIMAAKKCQLQHIKGCNNVQQTGLYPHRVHNETNSILYITITNSDAML